MKLTPYRSGYGKKAGNLFGERRCDGEGGASTTSAYKKYYILLGKVMHIKWASNTL